MIPLPTAATTPLLLPGWTDPENLIRASGPYVLRGVAFVVLTEAGLFAVLPGDSLPFVCVVLTGCAVGGNVYGNRALVLVSRRDPRRSRRRPRPATSLCVRRRLGPCARRLDGQVR